MRVHTHTHCASGTTPKHENSAHCPPTTARSAGCHSPAR